MMFSTFNTYTALHIDNTEYGINYDKNREFGGNMDVSKLRIF